METNQQYFVDDYSGVRGPFFTSTSLNFFLGYNSMLGWMAEHAHGSASAVVLTGDARLQPVTYDVRSGVLVGSKEWTK